MARKSDFDQALNKIKSQLNRGPYKSYTEWSLGQLFLAKKDAWGISKSKQQSHFESFVMSRKLLEKKEFRDENGRNKTIYAIPGIGQFTLYFGLHQKGYYTHYTAMYLNEMTLQIPKVHYLNFEHYSAQNRGPLLQDAIHKVFNKAQRRSHKQYTYGGERVVLINGKFTNRLGVIKKRTKNSSYDYTDLERTLIDIAIRPVYSGGVIEVQKAYENAKGIMDPIKLIKYLKLLDYLYPYEQAIGFYLENAGYSEDVLKHFENDGQFHFYLTYDIRNQKFSKRWKLYYPSGM